jgi:hypothetical protein
MSTEWELPGRLSESEAFLILGGGDLPINFTDETWRKNAAHRVDSLVFDCDIRRDLCQSERTHVHRITHQLDANGGQPQTAHVRWEGGEELKQLVYTFDRKSQIPAPPKADEK